MSFQPVGAISQHDAPEALVGDDQVGSSANHHGGDAARASRVHGGGEGLRAVGFGIDIGRSADAEARVAGKRSAGGDGQPGNRGETRARLFRGRHYLNYSGGGRGGP